MAPMANPDMLDNPAYLETIHQFHCLLMADADGAHPAHLDPLALLALLDLLVPKEALVLLAALATTEVLAPLAQLVKLDLLAQLVNPDLVATMVRMRLQAPKETLDLLAAEEIMEAREQMAIVVLPAMQAQPEILDQPDQLEVLEMQAKKEQMAHLAVLAALAQMPNTVHAPIVPRKLKQPSANSICRKSCPAFDR